MSFHHNLYAHNRTRNPFAGSYRDRANHCDWRNNVIYNGGDGHGGTNWHKLYPDRWGPENVGRLPMNYINNYWIRGPQGAGTIYRGGDQATIYQSGNLFDDTNNGVLDGTDKGWAVFANYHEKARFTRATEEFPYPRVATDSAEVTDPARSAITERNGVLGQSGHGLGRSNRSRRVNRYN